MMNSMKWLVVAALLVVAGPMVSCGDDEAGISCPAGKVKIAVPAGSCKTFYDKICACKPLPTGANQADCDLLAQGYACDDPGATIDNQGCKDIMTGIETNKIDVCKEDLSGK